MHQTKLSALALVAVLACGGANTPAPENPEPAPQPQPAEPIASAGFVDTCKQAFARQAECTDAFIPALVDARIAVDKPPGIAERARTDGRDALVSEALSEWTQDSTPAAAATTCEGVAGATPPETLDAMASEASECLTRQGCPEFVECILPLITRHLR